MLGYNAIYDGERHNVRVGLVSLAAVFVSSRNAPPEERCVTRQNRLRGRLGWSPQPIRSPIENQVDSGIMDHILD